MKYVTVLPCLLLLAFSVPTYAHDSAHAQECAKEGDKIKDTKTKNAFLASCLKKIDMTEFQMAEKAEQCDQNAINKKLSGLKKDQYLEHCYLEGETRPKPKQEQHPK